MKFNVPRRAHAARFFWSRTQAPDAAHRRALDSLREATRQWYAAQRPRKP